MFSFQTSAELTSLPFITNKDAISESTGVLTLITTIQAVTKPSDFEIFDALKADNISHVVSIILKNHGVNAVDEWGQTPLMIATIKLGTNKAYASVVAELLNSKKPYVNINAAKSSGYTVSII